MLLESILVVAQEPERLRPVFGSQADGVTFCDDLNDIDAVLERVQPQAALLFSDIGFTGEPFRRVAHHPSVKWVHVSGSGYEYLHPIERDDLTISNGHGLRARYLAETLLGAMITLNGQLLTYRDHQRAGIWNPLTFKPLQGQTVLVVGMGAIGTWFARYAKTLGMTVIGVNRSGAPVEPCDRTIAIADLDTVLSDADVVSVHLRQTPETEGLFDQRRLGLMKPTALFLNTARGGIIDEAALCHALEFGDIRGAYLDVFATEPLDPDSPLWRMDTVLMSPHAADMIEGWDVKSAMFFVENLGRWRNSEPLHNLVRSPDEPEKPRHAAS